MKTQERKVSAEVELLIQDSHLKKRLVLTSWRNVRTVPRIIDKWSSFVANGRPTRILFELQAGMGDTPGPPKAH